MKDWKNTITAIGARRTTIIVITIASLSIGLLLWLV